MTGHLVRVLRDVNVGPHTVLAGCVGRVDRFEGLFVYVAFDGIDSPRTTYTVPVPIADVEFYLSPRQR